MREQKKIVVIYSNVRKESTFNCVKIFKDELQKENNINFTEFILPRDMPHICLGCFRCFELGAEKCPHQSSIEPIVHAILRADGIILSSPVYSLDASCAIKTLFDHMCYLWITHRPQEEMFNKMVMVISTTAGAGIKTSIKTLKKSPSYWGVKRIFSYGIRLRANRWNNVSDKNKNKIATKLKKKAKQFSKAMMHRDELKPRMLVRFLFPTMGKMIGGYEADSLLHKDIEYWQEKGWFNGRRPY